MEPGKENVYLQISGELQSITAWLSKESLTPNLHGARLEKNELTVSVLVPKGHEDRVKRAGFRILRNEPQRERSAMALVDFLSPADRFQTGDPPPALGAGQPQGVYQPYYSDQEYQTALRNLAQTYGALTELFTLNERTWQDRDVWALRLSLQPAANKPAIVMLGCLHADEWGGCEVLLQLASDLLYSVTHGVDLQYGNHVVPASEARRLMDERDLILVPVVNPDGRHASQTDYRRPDTRRNARPKNGDRSSTPFAEAVDLNRNFNFLFKVDEFDSEVAPKDLDDQMSENYHGPSAESEPETRNIRGLLDDYPQISWLVDLHRPGLTIRFPWAVDESQDTNSAMNFKDVQFRGKRGKRDDAYREFLCQQDAGQLQQLASRFMADVQSAGGPQFTMGPWYVNEPMPGSCLDYAYSRHLENGQLGKVLSFLVEMDGEYNQPKPELMTSILGYAVAGLIGFGLQTLV